jgi:branched-chain amino acid transport system ATP-binding protein
MLSIKNIYAGYGDFVALKDISFDLEQGTVLSIVGSNGSGKTTIMRAICGLVKPMKGNILLSDTDITMLQAYKVAELGVVYVPEGRRLFNKMSILDNLLVGSYLKQNRVHRKENLDKVYTMFPKLYERRNQKAGTLSGGEQQMLAISRGLMACPKILMLDEPSLGIAPVIVDTLFEIISDLKKQKLTIIISEQNVARALSVADKGIVIQSGRIVMVGDSAELAQTDTIRKAYLGM